MISTNGRQSFIGFLYNGPVPIDNFLLRIVMRGTNTFDYSLFEDDPEVGEHVYRIDGSGEAWSR